MFRYLNKTDECKFNADEKKGNLSLYIIYKIICLEKIFDFYEYRNIEFDCNIL